MMVNGFLICIFPSNLTKVIQNPQEIALFSLSESAHVQHEFYVTIPMQKAAILAERWYHQWDKGMPKWGFNDGFKQTDYRKL
jgi:hypothetical protein